MKVVCYNCKSLIKATANVLGTRTFKILCAECYTATVGGLHLGQHIDIEDKSGIQADNKQLLPFIVAALLVNNV